MGKQKAFEPERVSQKNFEMKLRHDAPPPFPFYGGGRHNMTHSRRDLEALNPKFPPRSLVRYPPIERWLAPPEASTVAKAAQQARKHESGRLGDSPPRLGLFNTHDMC